MIYFIQAIDGGPIKIGVTVGVTPKRRLQAIQNMCPVKLHILKVIAGDTNLEQELHRRFAGFRLHGEWFRDDPELLAFIDSQAPFVSEKEPEQPIEISKMVLAEDVAEDLEVSSRTISRWVESGYFPGSIRRNPRAHNSTYLVPRDSVEKFKQERASTETRKD